MPSCDIVLSKFVHIYTQNRLMLVWYRRHIVSSLCCLCFGSLSTKWSVNVGTCHVSLVRLEVILETLNDNITWVTENGNMLCLIAAELNLKSMTKVLWNVFSRWKYMPFCELLFSVCILLTRPTRISSLILLRNTIVRNRDPIIW